MKYLKICMGAIVTVACAQNHISDKMELPSVKQAELLKDTKNFNAEFIEAIFNDEKIGAVFSVFNAENHIDPWFIDNWEGTEKGSSEAFLAALKYTLKTNTEELTFSFIKNLRDNLIFTDTNTKTLYPYTEKKFSMGSLGTYSDKYGFSYGFQHFSVPKKYDFKTNCISAIMENFSNNSKKGFISGMAIKELLELLELNHSEVSTSPQKIQEVSSNLCAKAYYSINDFEKLVKSKYTCLEKVCLFADPLSRQFEPDLSTIYNISMVNDWNKLESTEQDEKAYTLFTQILQTYEKKMLDHNKMTIDEKYKEIITLVKIMEMLHWYNDFNLRTWYIIMLKEFIRFDLPVTMLLNPNCIDYFSVELLMELCKVGAIRVENLLEHGNIFGDQDSEMAVGSYEYGIQ